MHTLSVLAALGLVLPACLDGTRDGRVTGPDAAAADVAVPPMAALGCGTLHDHDCPNAEWCYGEPTCGAPWTCSDAYPGCSAAPPSLGCGCDGRVVSLAAGCPERHAWRLPHFVGADPGAPCDAAARSPLSLTLVVEGWRLGDLAAVRLLPRHPALGPEVLVPVEAGGFVHRVVGVSEAGSHWTLGVFGDRDGDGRCGEGDLVGWANPSGFDALLLEVRYAITPGLAPGACDDVVGP